jgi:hypothetical protein
MSCSVLFSSCLRKSAVQGKAEETTDGAHPECPGQASPIKLLPGALYPQASVKSN